MLTIYKNVFKLTLSFLIINSTFSQSNRFASPIDSIIKLLKTDQEDTNKVKHLNELNWEFMYQNTDTAILLGEQALELATVISTGSLAAKNPELKKAAEKGMAQSYNNLGNCYWLLGNYPVALASYFKALKIRHELDDKKAVSASLSNIGNIYYMQGDFIKAKEYYLRAFKLAEELGNKYDMASYLGNIGAVYIAQTDYSKALKYYFRALKLCEEVGDKIVSAIFLDNIGNAYGNQGNYSKALEYYFKALKLSEEIGNKNNMALTLSNIGGLYVKKKRYKEGEDCFLKAVGISTEIGSLDLIKNLSLHLRDIYVETNRYQLAYEYFVKYTIAKDSLFNEEKSKEIGRLEMQHEIEMAEMEKIKKEEEELKKKTQKKERRNLLEYSGMVIGLLIIGLLIAVLGFIKVKPWMAEGITFFAFLLFFEFILVLLDPYMDKFTKGEPAYKLVLNALVAACIFPVHAVFEKMLKKRLMKKNL